MMESRELANKIAEVLDKKGAMDIQILEIEGKNENCPVCSDHPTITELIQYEEPSCSI